MEAIKLGLSVFDQHQKLRLLPFVVTATFYLVQPYPTQSFLGVVFKILPILSLIGYVVMTKSQFPTKTKKASLETILPDDEYSLFVVLGLLGSVIGDILVTIPYLVLVGGLVFLMVHLAYYIGIEVSGRHRACGSSYASLFVLLFLNMFVALQSGLDSFILKLFIFIYLVPLFLTGWKAAAAMEYNPGDKAVMMACIGASVFIFSDFLVILDFNGFPIPFAEHLYMLTYYTAQFGWAVSTSNYS